MSTEIVKHEEAAQPVSISSGASLSEVVNRIKLIDRVLREVMQKGVHYDVIPGTGDKPSLLKPGAEKLCALFNLGTTLNIQREDLPGNHREYIVTLTVVHYPSGKVIGQGIGSCSTMEAKYRYRNVADYEIIDDPIPKDAKERKQEYRKQGYGMKKVDGQWHWVKYGDESKTENPDVADVFNTVLKMAKKRALVDGVLTATGASDLFTQDVEDLPQFEKPAQAHETKPDKEDKRYAQGQKEEELAEGHEVWRHVQIDDVEENTSGDKTFYIVKLADGRTCGTFDEALADAAAHIEGGCSISVKPGRKKNAWVYLGEFTELE